MKCSIIKTNRVCVCVCMKSFCSKNSINIHIEVLPSLTKTNLSPPRCYCGFVLCSANAWARQQCETHSE